MRPLFFRSKPLPTGLGLALLSGLALAAGPAHAQYSYNYSSFYNETSIDVSLVDANGYGATGTAVYGLSDTGQIAGSYTTPLETDSRGNILALSATHGFFGTAATQTSVDGPVGQASTDSPFAEINKINSSGTYAGDFEASGPTGTDSSEGFTGSGGSAAATNLNNSQALGISNAGSTVGTVLSGDGTFYHSYVQSSNGTLSVFDVPGYATSQAAGINDAGVIVGNAAASVLDAPSVGYVDTGGALSFVYITRAYETRPGLFSRTVF